MKTLTTHVCKFIATLGPVGSLPASGTMGTLCALPFIIGLRKLERSVPYLDEGVLVALALIGVVWIIDQSLVAFNHAHDPREIVLDEVIGAMVAMMFVPLSPLNVLLAFAYFRFFDITKPFGIDRLQAINGGWGIVLDDIAAAVWAHIALDITLYFL